VYTWKDEEYDRTIRDIAERLKNAESRQSNQSDVLATLKGEILPHELQAKFDIDIYRSSVH